MDIITNDVYNNKNIGITHVFSCINICQVPRKLFERTAVSPRDLASVNTLKQTCVIVILAYFTPFQPKQLWKRRLNIEIFLFLNWISHNKMVSASNFRTSLRRHNVIDAHNVFPNKSIHEMISQGRNAYPCNVMPNKSGPSLSFDKLKVMFIQPVNLMV